MIMSKAASQPAISKCVLVELPRVVGDTSFDGDAGVIGRVVNSSSSPDVCLDLKGDTRRKYTQSNHAAAELYR